MKCPPLTIYYDTHDDGIHVGCGKCGFELILGFDVTTANVVAAEQQHQDQ